MPDFPKIVESILVLIFRDKIPPIVPQIFGYIFLVLFIIFAIWVFLSFLSKIKRLWNKDVKPIFYDAEKRRRRKRRQQFANHIEYKIKKLCDWEDWSESRFAELEAEVEAEGRERVFSLIPFLKKNRGGLRREHSLSKALESSRERLILLEGEPGSGKSVALRYVAQSMARRAIKAKNINAVIPIYINLKELNRQKREPIDRNLIETFVLNTLNPGNDRDIEEFLEKEFVPGLRNSTWLFLFDSFDELPEVLSSTEADEIIRRYGDAISDFLHGMNQCRGIIASRQFRGPGRLGWPRFRILPLSEKRRLELIKRANLETKVEKEIVGQLELALPEIRSMANNPMFLGLLCENMKSGQSFPHNTHHVFETYIENRLVRDKERLSRRYNLKPQEVRNAAETVAFSMTANRDIGLSPSRQSLKDVLISADHRVINIKRLDTYLDALEYIKLARSETATSAGESKAFTFSHRRFQEYFATCVLMRNPDLVRPDQLLTDARWREAAVVMCQTQPQEVLSPLLDEARRFLNDLVSKTPGLIKEPLAYVQASASEEKEKRGKSNEKIPEPFSWAKGTLHILELLQDGFGSHLDDLPEDIKMLAARIIVSVNETGTLSDRKCGLEVAGIMSRPVLTWLLRNAFTSGSQWLKEVAYRQAARLPEIPADIARWIRQSLMGLLADGRLKRERLAVKAHLSRLDKPDKFLSAMNLLQRLPNIEAILHVLIFLLMVIGISGRDFSIKLFTISSLSILILPVSYFWGLRVLIRSFIDSDFEINAYNMTFAVMEIMIKFMLLQFIFSVFAFQKITISFYPFFLLILVCFYFVAWSPSALSAVKKGRFIHPLWWPVMPITLLFRSTNSDGEKFVKFIKDWKILIKATLIGICFPGLFLLAHFYIKWLFWLIGFLMLVFISLPSVLLFMIFMYTKLKSLIQWCWWKWKPQADKRMSGVEFLAMITQFKENSGLRRFIKSVREEQLLEVNRDSEALIEDLALAIEQGKKVQSFKSNVFDRWYSDYLKRKESQFFSRVERIFGKSNFTLADLGSEVLDEVSMLLEQIRRRRRD